MRKIISIAALPVATLLVSSLATAGGEIYRWKDANGVPHYSDQPQPGAELIKSGSRRNDSAAAPTPAAPAPATTIATDNSAPPLSREVAQQVRQEAASAKAEQCKKQQEAYQRAVQARRIVKVDEKGNKVFLSDSEIDAARLEARANRDRACDPAAP
jgi:hypothetical protein